MKYRVATMPDRFVEAEGLPTLGEGVIFGCDVRLGKGVKIWNYTVIQDNCVLGDNVMIGSFVDIGKNVTIGNNTQIQAHCTISNDCKVGNDVFIGPNTTLLNDRYPHSNKLRPVVIEDKVAVGGGVIIMPDVVVYRNAFIAGAAVVTRDVPPNTSVKSPAVPAYPYEDRDTTSRKKMSYEAGPNKPHSPPTELAPR